MLRLNPREAQQPPRVLLVLFFLLLLFGTVSCTGSPTPTIARLDALPEAALQTTSPPSAEEVVSPEASAMPCAYVWVNQDLPDVGESLRKALVEAGLPNIEASANTLGENCIEPATGSTVRFLPMQTDFSFVISVESIDDAQELGEWIEKILPLLEQFPPGQVPGPNPGYVRIQFLGKSAQANLYFPLQSAQDLLSDGLHGSALYRALESQ